MKSAALKINDLLENLEQEDKADVEAVVASLIGAIPDTGKTLEEYRNERLKNIEFIQTG